MSRAERERPFSRTCRAAAGAEERRRRRAGGRDARLRPHALGGSAAAASSSGGSLTGTLVLLTYPQWYGPNELPTSRSCTPGSPSRRWPAASPAAAQIAQISTNQGAFDVTLSGVPVSSQLKLAGLLEPFDAAAVPNVKLIGAPFRQAFPFGIPTDFGKTGFAYRRDLIKERPTSWHELWALAKKYSGRPP